MENSNINQITIGTLNRINNPYSVGSIEGLNFIACAIGSHLHILTERFEKIHVIHCDINNCEITAVSCCSESGKQFVSTKKLKFLSQFKIFPYTWTEAQSWSMEDKIGGVHWVLEGFRLLLFVGTELILYQDKIISCSVAMNKPAQTNGIKFTLNSDEEIKWEVIWRIKLANKIKHVRFSNDGTLFATCGSHDPFVKIWYQLKDSFSFIYLQHPSSVCGFEWRHSGGFLMPRKLVHNALITWCEDNTARIWKEVQNGDTGLQYNFINDIQHAIVQQNGHPSVIKPKHNPHRVSLQMRKAKARLIQKFTHHQTEKKKPDIQNSTQVPDSSVPVRPSSIADFSIPNYASGNPLVFCLIATINAEDCLLVPAISRVSENKDDDVKRKRHSRLSFSVHWLNNKEYDFEMGTQKVLAENLAENESRDLSPCQIVSMHSSSSSAGFAADFLTPHPGSLSHPLTSPNLIKTSQQAAELNDPMSNDSIDHKLEGLLRHWVKSCDILFAIHPMDGSLLTWTLEWLDDYWKQPTVSFASRIPEAFPLSDAVSLLSPMNTLRPSLHILFEYSHKRKSDIEEQSHTQDFQAFLARNKYLAKNNEIYLLTNHRIGTLNLWRIQIENTPNESVIQHQNIPIAASVTNVVHGYRICKPSNEPTNLEIHKNEGLFDAACLSTPLLPQYHPTQLVGMLNAGKIQRVRAILLNVLHALRANKQVRKLSSVRRYSFGRQSSVVKRQTIDYDFDPDVKQRRNSISARSSFNNNVMEQNQVDSIPSLPLYALLLADEVSENATNSQQSQLVTRSSFDKKEDDFDDQSDDERKNSVSRSRKFSIGSLNEASFLVLTNPGSPPAAKFTANHARYLTDILTHTHLHGLSNTDQMHLLAVADTISHFSSSAVDRLAHANAMFEQESSANDKNEQTTFAYTTGMETVDECGLRFLMAKKQYEYLLRCLPLKQRKQLKTNGISSAYVIWAFHSDTEAELLSSIPCVQRQQENWDEMRSYGVAWWLRNVASLRTCIERVAKNIFQKDQNPLDAALFYLAMRKKNVLTQLFKTVNDTRMYEFFREDFTQEKWKKASLKNAFILMSKQRFHHAAAFFLLAGSIKDALQIILARIHDLQLAIVILRLYEVETEAQFELLSELLCKEVLGCEVEHFRQLIKNYESKKTVEPITFPNARGDPFERSMSLWIMNEYVFSVETFLEEANDPKRIKDREIKMERTNSDDTLRHFEPSFPDIFNFYSFLRRHPLVIRQKLTRAGIAMTTTEHFLTWTRRIGSRLSDSEKRLYLRTANAHLDSGCPLLSLDVLTSLPKQFGQEAELEVILPDVNRPSLDEQIDWSMPVSSKLNQEERFTSIKPEINGNSLKKDLITKHELSTLDCSSELQDLKLFSTLSIMTDELTTLANGDYEIPGGQLRLKLYCWLERECEVLKNICYSQEDDFEDEVNEDEENSQCSSNIINNEEPTSSIIKGTDEELPPLHEALEQDRIELKERKSKALKRRLWLKRHQKILHSLAAYCALHGSRNIRLIAVQMELLLLLMEAQRDKEVSDIRTFPLLAASLSPNVNSPISPLRFMSEQCASLLSAINQFDKIPQIDTDVSKVMKLFSLCQGLSFCVYQSLSNIELFNQFRLSPQTFSGPLTQPIRRTSVSVTAIDELDVRSQPQHWPGVDSLIKLLNRESLLDNTPPNLRLLLVEFFSTIFLSTFLYAFTFYDSRLLYRLAAHPIGNQMFGEIFGGGGEHKLKSAIPVRPPPPRIGERTESNSQLQQQNSNQVEEIALMRAKLHAKVFAPSSKATINQKLPSKTHQGGASEQIIQCWIPPRKHILQYFTDKVLSNQIGTVADAIFDDYDSDQESNEEKELDETTTDYFKFQSDLDELSLNKERIYPHCCHDSYAWQLIRLALLRLIISKIECFVELAGFDLREVARRFPKLEQSITCLNLWAAQIEAKLGTDLTECPPDFLPNMHVQELSDSEQHQNHGKPVAATPTLNKYHNLLLEHGNTPFEYDETGVKPVRRLWIQLVHQESLMPLFVRFIFGKEKTKSLSSFTDGSVESRCGRQAAPKNIISQFLKILN
ncbi:unnamed protein product [Meloidogyne enterolobii]|uniref:Uncharacterized protein n=1 Tax=Meloidogyne enterolobii TaxID=390850 RepID=A0ACB0XLB7_MELEN